jgi:hypothetical protein
MKKFVPLLALLALPAQAQDAQVYYASSTWPVHVSGNACSLNNAAPDESNNALKVNYDSRAGEVVLTIETRDISSGLNATGTLSLGVVLLDNGTVKHDDGWSPRTFNYTHQNGVTRFTTRIAGKRSARQFLSDLGTSRHLGLIYQGQAISSTSLSGVSPSLTRLDECSRQTFASR